jgi:hypothetical protein
MNTNHTVLFTLQNIIFFVCNDYHFFLKRFKRSTAQLMPISINKPAFAARPRLIRGRRQQEGASHPIP